MSFWSDASGVTKAAVVAGPVLIIVAAYLWFAGGHNMWPFHVDVVQERGITQQ